MDLKTKNSSLIWSKTILMGILQETKKEWLTKHQHRVDHPSSSNSWICLSIKIMINSSSIWFNNTLSDQQLYHKEAAMEYRWKIEMMGDHPQQCLDIEREDISVILIQSCKPQILQNFLNILISSSYNNNLRISLRLLTLKQL